MIRKKDEEPVPTPSREEIIDLAITMAQEDRGGWLEKPMRDLFHWPRSGTPCRDHRAPYLETVEKYKKKAEEELRRHYEYHHRLTMKRKRWLKAHPKPRGWAWTRQPVKHTHPPPRRRVARPPGTVLPEAMAPPLGPAPGAPPSRPRRRIPERLLCFSWLFDNKIAA